MCENLHVPHNRSPDSWMEEIRATVGKELRKMCAMKWNARAEAWGTNRSSPWSASWLPLFSSRGVVGTTRSATAGPPLDPHVFSVVDPVSPVFLRKGNSQLYCSVHSIDGSAISTRFSEWHYVSCTVLLYSVIFKLSSIPASENVVYHRVLYTIIRLVISQTCAYLSLVVNQWFLTF